MSLKDFVSQPDVSARLKAILPTPTVPNKPPLRAPPLTKNYSLVGTAFDYLLRFYVQRINPCAKAMKWIAEEAAFGEAGVGKKIISLEEIVDTTKGHHKKYLASGIFTDDLLRSTLALAQLDALRRRPDLLWDNSYFETLGDIDPLDVTDLRQLLALVRPEDFRVTKTCVLNPTFGAASKLVRGADCDLLLDTTIMEIKTTKHLSLSREYLNQLLGYALLARIGGINGAPSQVIDTIGIYFSRFGNLWKFDLSRAIAPHDLSELTVWFEQTVQKILRP
jgi:hypothetical protein